MESEENIPIIQLIEEQYLVSNEEETNSPDELESVGRKLRYTRLKIRLKNNASQIAGGLLLVGILAAFLAVVTIFLAYIGLPHWLLAVIGLLCALIMHQPILQTINIFFFRTPAQIFLALRSCCASKTPKETVSMYVRACLGFGEFGTEYLGWPGADWPLAYVCLSSRAKRAFETQENFISFWSETVQEIRQITSNIMNWEKGSIYFHWLPDNEAVIIGQAGNHNEVTTTFSCHVGIKNNFDHNLYKCKMEMHGTLVRVGYRWYIDSSRYSIEAPK